MKWINTNPQITDSTSTKKIATMTMGKGKKIL
ncbi:hypothetical protein J3D55_003166 [Chryseobacterium ginsenosidimutans]|nr:hypothetical protein [Chryseobacterium ginsenosidimutans]